MKQVSVRFYEELNEFLPRPWRKQQLTYEFISSDTVRNLLNSFGVPHTEVDLVLINGESVDFERELKGGESVSIYPVFESIDISKTTRLRPKALRTTRFILDVHLGKLTSYLRMLGFDSLYRNNLKDKEIIRIAEQENRIILTRDKGILHNKKVTHGFYIPSDAPREQLKQVLRRFDLLENIRPFSRCMNCNGKLKKTAKNNIIEQLEENTRKYFHEFYRCDNCGKIYWKGNHYHKMLAWIQELKQ